jgi:diacylglycerol diphosphate phosphatase/phosphatidate phosphatase
MGLFNRGAAAPVAADATTATGAHHEKKPGMFARKDRNARTTASRSHGVSSYNSRPTFGQWLKATWLDILTMAIMGAIGLGVYMADPAPSRSFPSTYPSPYSRKDGPGEDIFLSYA